MALSRLFTRWNLLNSQPKQISREHGATIFLRAGGFIKSSAKGMHSSGTWGTQTAQKRRRFQKALRFLNRISAWPRGTE